MKKFYKISEYNIQTLYLLLLTQAVSLVGSRMTSVGIGIWLYQSMGRTTDLLLIPFFYELPGLVFSHYFGALVDRYSRKKMIMISDCGQAVGTLILMGMGLTGQIHLPLLYMAIVLQGVFAALQNPASDAVISQMIVETHRERVNGLKEMTFPAAGMLAPTLAGLLLIRFGIGSVIAVDLITFLLAVGSVSLMRFPQVDRNETMDEKNLTKQSLEGYIFLKRSRGLLQLVLYVGFVNVLLNGPLELIVPLVIKRLNEPTNVGLILSVMSMSTFAGGFIISYWRGTRPRIYTLIGSILVSGVGMAILSFQGDLVGVAATLAVTMLPLPIFNAVFKSILQIKTPEALQGRVFGTVFQIAYGLAPFSFVVTGPIVDRLTEPAMLKGSWPLLTLWFGGNPGSGICVILFITGLLLVLISLVAILYPKIRFIEELCDNENLQKNAD